MMQKTIEHTEELAKAIAKAADERKADNIVILNVEPVCYLTDYFVIATGFSKTQVRAIADYIEQKVALEFNKYPRQTEGKPEGNWILQDFGEVIVHIFLPQERAYYNLEAFWGHAERLEFNKILSNVEQ